MKTGPTMAFTLTPQTTKSVRIEDFKQHNWIKSDSEIITYHSVINFDRAAKKAAHHCVMCGLMDDGHSCFIPNQNKDVCRRCDSSYWLMKEFNVVVKFCKGMWATYSSHRKRNVI